MTCSPCQRGKPDLLPANAPAWEVWLRTRGQGQWGQVREGRGDKTYFVLRQLTYDHAAVWRVIDAMAPPEPLEVFDKVMIIEAEFAKAREEAEARDV